MNILIILLILYLINNFIKKNKRSNEIGIALPIIGHLHKIAVDTEKNDPHKLFTKLSKKYANKDGVFKLWIGDSLINVVNDPVIARKIFIDNSDNFSNRPKLPSLQKFSNGFRGVSFASGEGWRKSRKFLSCEITKTKILSLYIDSIDKNIKFLLSKMKSTAHSNQLFDPRSSFGEFVSGNMHTLLYNKTVEREEDRIKINYFFDLISKTTKYVSNQNLDDYIWWTSPFYYFENKDFQAGIDELNSLSRIEYDNHVANLDVNNPKDIIDYLLISSQGMDKEQVIQICFDLIAGGVDTAEKSFEWICLYLINNPDVQEKAYKELINVVGNDCRYVDIKNRTKCQYLLAIFKESLRLRPSAPMSVPRLVENDITIGDTFFSKGSQIFLNIYGISNDPKYYEEPNKFIPERWIGEGKTECEYNLFSFNVGPRACPGINLYDTVTFLAISNILLNFEIQSTNGQKLNDTEIFGVTIFPEHYHIKLLPRN